MFKLKTNVEFAWPVKVQVPTDGRHVEQPFTARFKQVDRSRFVDLNNGDAEEETNLLREVLIGWDGIGDENGEPIPFSEQTRDQLLEIPYVRTAIVEAFFEGIAGRKRKN